MSPTHPILELYAKRHTIRRYRQEPLAEGDLERIVAAGQQAPTGGAVQIYSIVRITDSALRDQLSRLSGDQAHIREAAEFFVFCVDVHRAGQLLEQSGTAFAAGPLVTVHYGTMEVLLAAANVATAAEALGYGTCFIGAILDHLDVIAGALQLPQGVVPVVGLTVGVPDEDVAALHRPRLPQALILHENTYGTTTPKDLKMAREAMGEAWVVTLQRFLGPNGILARREPVWRRTLTQQGFEH